MKTQIAPPAECKDCRQGYTKEGFAAYPDHIELCNLHAATQDLLAVLKRCEHMAELWVKTAIAERDSTALGNAKAHYDDIKAAIAKAEAKP